jgi:hypothetical protein
MCWLALIGEDSRGYSGDSFLSFPDETNASTMLLEHLVKLMFA